MSRHNTRRRNIQYKSDQRTARLTGTSLESQRRATSKRALCQPGIVAFARVPFTDDPTQYKIRPVIVIGWSANGKVVQVRPVTTKITQAVGNTPIRFWEQAGLSQPCAVRTQTLDIERLEFHGSIGMLHPMDRAALGVPVSL